MSERQERYERWLEDCALLLDGVLPPEPEPGPERQSWPQIADVVNELRAALDGKPSGQG